MQISGIFTKTKTTKLIGGLNSAFNLFDFLNIIPEFPDICKYQKY